MQGLTKRQQMVLDYITQTISDCGYPPTLREIGSHMGIRSTNGVNDHLRALERKGYLRREDMKSRALKPVNQDDSRSEAAVSIPIVSRTTAGRPVLSEQNVDDTVTVDRFFIGNQQKVFCLKVNDNSMKDAGFAEGDFLFLRKQMHADRGEIIAAAVNNEILVRYYRPEPNKTVLAPASSKHKSIAIQSKDFNPTQILGVVIGLFRRI